MGAVDTSNWPWWWSTDEERYRGPCSSRTNAIMEAWSEGEHASIHLIQAQHGDVNCALWDATQIAEQFDEVNYEMGDPEGDGLSVDFKDGDFEQIARSLESAVRSMVRRRGVMPFAFSSQTGGEWVELAMPALLSLPPAAIALIADLSRCWQSESSYEPYVNERLSELRETLKVLKVEID